MKPQISRSYFNHILWTYGNQKKFQWQKFIFCSCTLTFIIRSLSTKMFLSIYCTSKIAPTSLKGWCHWYYKYYSICYSSEVNDWYQHYESTTYKLVNLLSSSQFKTCLLLNLLLLALMHFWIKGSSFFHDAQGMCSWSLSEGVNSTL